MSTTALPLVAVLALGCAGSAKDASDTGTTLVPPMTVPPTGDTGTLVPPMTVPPTGDTGALTPPMPPPTGDTGAPTTGDTGALTPPMPYPARADVVPGLSPLPGTIAR
jgi:hypothetical protein